ncbi:MAG: hypothetical protein IJZ04_01955 [Clostridia bacterium]|nr:hypothetical protein [Clostridia bacterium]
MDRFSKTTDIDTAEVAAASADSDTPKKSRVGSIIAFTVCIVLAIFIWLWVMETDTTVIQREFNDVQICSSFIDSEPIGYADITVKGVRKNIVDLKAKDFKIVEANGKYEIYLLSGESSDLVLTNESTATEIIVSVSEK